MGYHVIIIHIFRFPPKTPVTREVNWVNKEVKPLISHLCGTGATGLHHRGLPVQLSIFHVDAGVAIHLRTLQETWKSAAKIRMS